MIINRHNYEEFFLLYVDKELEAEGYTAVENFARQNPDLAKELETLQQATLVNNSIQFTEKELLYKKENSISLADYEEYFLLAADNELSKQLSIEVENFVLKHPQLQDEFTLLQQTKLQPELIAFAGKEKLYRKEKKERRIIPFILIRVGAAAAVAGIVYTSSIIINNNKSSDKTAVIASQNLAKATSEKNNSLPLKSETEKTDTSLYPEKEIRNIVKNAAVNRINSGKNNLGKFKKIQKREEAIAVNKVKSVNERKEPFSEQSLAEIATQKPEPVQEENHVKNFNGNSNPDKVNNNNIVINQPISTEDHPLVTHAVYLETDNNEEEKTIYIGSAEINKNKLKGLLKKAAVFLDKKLRRNDE